MTIARKWSLMAAVLVLAIVAAGWFLLISPKRGEAAALRTKAASEEAANERLLQQLSVLKAQQAELPAQRAKLAVARTQIPDNPALPTLIRDLTSAGRKVGVSIDAMSPAVPTPVVLPQVAPVAPPATTTESESSGEAAGEAGTTPAPATPVAPPAPSLYQVPLSLTVSGSYFELEQFVNKLEALKRSFLVTGFTLAVNEQNSSDAAATVSTGALKLELQGRVFLSPEGALTTTPATTPAAATPVAPATAS